MPKIASQPQPANRLPTCIARWLLISLTVFVLTLVGGIYLTWEVLPMVYTANALIQISASGATPFSEIETAVKSDSEVIQTPQILLPVIHGLNLNKIWAARIFKSQAPLSDLDALVHLQKNVDIDLTDSA